MSASFDSMGVAWGDATSTFSCALFFAIFFFHAGTDFSPSSVVAVAPVSAAVFFGKFFFQEGLLFSAAGLTGPCFLRDWPGLPREGEAVLLFVGRFFFQEGTFAAPPCAGEAGCGLPSETGSLGLDFFHAGDFLTVGDS